MPALQEDSVARLRVCSACGVGKPLTSFSRCGGRNVHLHNRRCRACVQVKDTMRRRLPHNSVKRAKHREANRARLREASRDYRAANRPGARVRTLVANAKRRGLLVERDAALRFYQTHDDVFTCYWCRVECSGDELEADRLAEHYGSFDAVVSSCACCNALRGDWGVGPVVVAISGDATPVILADEWRSAPPSVPAGSFSLRGCAHRARRRHRTKALVGDVLSADALMALWDPSVWPYADVTPLRPSPDRLDTSLGYVVGNVRWLPWLLNAALSGGYTLDTVLERARSVVGTHAA